jgi:hypothetical protein
MPYGTRTRSSRMLPICTRPIVKISLRPNEDATLPTLLRSGFITLAPNKTCKPYTKWL